MSQQTAFFWTFHVFGSCFRALTVILVSDFLSPYFTHNHYTTARCVKQCCPITFYTQTPKQSTTARGVKLCCLIHILHTNTQALYHSKMCKAVLSDPHFTHKHPSTRLSGNMWTYYRGHRDIARTSSVKSRGVPCVVPFLHITGLKSRKAADMHHSCQG